MLKCLLSTEKIDNLATIAKDSILAALYENIDDYETFIPHITDMNTRRIFREENDGFEATFDREKLIAAVKARPALVRMINATYDRWGRPKWMENVLKYILPTVESNSLAHTMPVE